MPTTVKDAIIMQTSSDIYDVREIQAWAELNSVNHRIDEAARLSLPPGFSLIKIKRDKHCMFRALARLMWYTQKYHNRARNDIMLHLRAEIRHRGTIQFMSFMKDVNMRYWGAHYYWGTDCKALTNSVGYSMKMFPVLASKKLLTSNKLQGISTLSRSNLSRIMDFLCGETPDSYFVRMTDPQNDPGSYPELVAFGQVYRRHIIVMHHPPLPHPSKRETRIICSGEYVREHNSMHLLCVQGNHYHALELMCKGRRRAKKAMK